MKPPRPLYPGETAFEEVVRRLASLPLPDQEQAPAEPAEPGGSCLRREIVSRADSAQPEFRRALREAFRRIVRFHRLARARPFAKRRKTGSLSGVRRIPYRSIRLDLPCRDWASFLLSAAGAASAAGVGTIACSAPRSLAESTELFAVLEAFGVERVAFGGDPFGEKDRPELVVAMERSRSSAESEDYLPIVGVLPLAMLIDETTDLAALFEERRERFGVPPVLVLAGDGAVKAVQDRLHASAFSVEALLVVPDLDGAVALLNRFRDIRVCLPIEKAGRVSRHLERASWVFLGDRTWPRTSDLFLTGTAVGVRSPNDRVRPLLAEDFHIQQVVVSLRGRDVRLVERFAAPLRVLGP